MRGILCLLVCSLSVLQPGVQMSTPSSPTYVAAVVEYNPDTGAPGDNRTEIVSKNVANYVQYIRKAAEQDADIIVFPECGLVAYGSGTSYATPLPNPEDLVNPCTDTSSNVTEAIRTLSCEAKNHNIYVVVNVPEVAPCPNASSNCDLYYNSNVVLDRSGTVVARYRKFNLFGEEGFSTTPEAEISILDTDFGVKFGIFTCFDILFEKPAVQLIKKWGVTDIIYPTAWFSELPFLTAVEAQASWAYGMNINLLAAGYNSPGVGSAGSGIYAGRDGPIKTIMTAVPTTKLLVATLPKKTSENSTISLNYVGSNSETLSHISTYSGRIDGNNSRILMLRDFLEPYETLLLNQGDFSIERKLCYNDLCCDFQVVMQTDHQNLTTTGKEYFYRLAVFDGIRSFTYETGGVQICAIVSCTNSSLSSCGYEFETQEESASYAVFEYIQISGNFRSENSTQLPATLVPGYGVLSSDKFQFTTREIQEKREVTIDMKMTSRISELMTFGIYGRDFLKDGGPVTEPSGSACGTATLVSLLLSVAVFLCVRSHY